MSKANKVQSFKDSTAEKCYFSKVLLPGSNKSTPRRSSYRGPISANPSSAKNSRAACQKSIESKTVSSLFNFNLNSSIFSNSQRPSTLKTPITKPTKVLREPEACGSIERGIRIIQSKKRQYSPDKEKCIVSPHQKKTDLSDSKNITEVSFHSKNSDVHDQPSIDHSISSNEKRETYSLRRRASLLPSHVLEAHIFKSSKRQLPKTNISEEDSVIYPPAQKVCVRKSPEKDDPVLTHVEKPQFKRVMLRANSVSQFLANIESRTNAAFSKKHIPKKIHSAANHGSLESRMDKIRRMLFQTNEKSNDLRLTPNKQSISTSCSSSSTLQNSVPKTDTDVGTNSFSSAQSLSLVVSTSSNTPTVKIPVLTSLSSNSKAEENGKASSTVNVLSSKKFETNDLNSDTKSTIMVTPATTSMPAEAVSLISSVKSVTSSTPAITSNALPSFNFGDKLKSQSTTDVNPSEPCSFPAKTVQINTSVSNNTINKTPTSSAPKSLFSFGTNSNSSSKTESTFTLDTSINPLMKNEVPNSNADSMKPIFNFASPSSTAKVESKTTADPKSLVSGITSVTSSIVNKTESTKPVFSFDKNSATSISNFSFTTNSTLPTKTTTSLSFGSNTASQNANAQAKPLFETIKNDVNSSSNSTSLFSFGGTTQTDKINEKPSFNFGQKTESSNSTSSKPFTFGGKADTQSASPLASTFKSTNGIFSPSKSDSKQLSVPDSRTLFGSDSKSVSSHTLAAGIDKKPFSFGENKANAFPSINQSSSSSTSGSIFGNHSSKLNFTSKSTSELFPSNSSTQNSSVFGPTPTSAIASSSSLFTNSASATGSPSLFSFGAGKDTKTKFPSDTNNSKGIFNENKTANIFGGVNSFKTDSTSDKPANAFNFGSTVSSTQSIFKAPQTTTSSALPKSNSSSGLFSFGSNAGSSSVINQNSASNTNAGGLPAFGQSATTMKFGSSTGSASGSFIGTTPSLNAEKKPFTFGEQKANPFGSSPLAKPVTGAFGTSQIIPFNQTASTDIFAANTNQSNDNAFSITSQNSMNGRKKVVGRRYRK